MNTSMEGQGTTRTPNLTTKWPTLAFQTFKRSLREDIDSAVSDVAFVALLGAKQIGKGTKL